MLTVSSKCSGWDRHIRIIVRYFLVEDKKEGAVGVGFFFSYGDDLILSFSLGNAWANPQCWIALVQSENLNGDGQFGVDLTVQLYVTKSSFFQGQLDISPFFFLRTEKTEELSRLAVSPVPVKGTRISLTYIWDKKQTLPLVLLCDSEDWIVWNPLHETLRW